MLRVPFLYFDSVLFLKGGNYICREKLMQHIHSVRMPRISTPMAMRLCRAYAGSTGLRQIK